MGIAHMLNLKHQDL
jgi:hypothetical protein